MPLASFRLFAAVVATLSAQLRRLDALAIEAAGRGVLVAAHPLANLRAQGVVEALPVPAGTPWAERPLVITDSVDLARHRSSSQKPVNSPANYRRSACR